MTSEKDNSHIIAYPDLYNSDAVTSKSLYKDVLVFDDEKATSIKNTKGLIPLHFSDIELLIRASRSWDKVKNKGFSRSDALKGDGCLTFLKTTMLISILFAGTIIAPLIYRLFTDGNFPVFLEPGLSALLFVSALFLACTTGYLMEKRECHLVINSHPIHSVIKEKYPQGIEELPLVQLYFDPHLYAKFCSTFNKLDNFLEQNHNALDIILDTFELSQAYDDFIQQYVFLLENKERISPGLFADYVVQLRRKSEKLISIIDDLHKVLDDYRAELDKNSKQIKELDQSIADEEAQAYYPIDRTLKTNGIGDTKEHDSDKPAKKQGGKYRDFMF